MKAPTWPTAAAVAQHSAEHDAESPPDGSLGSTLGDTVITKSALEIWLPVVLSERDRSWLSELLSLKSVRLPLRLDTREDIMQISVAWNRLKEQS